MANKKTQAKKAVKKTSFKNLTPNVDALDLSEQLQDEINPVLLSNREKAAIRAERRKAYYQNKFFGNE
jgi:hypothetical protein